MKSYYNVTFCWDKESTIYCANIAHAENADQVKEHYKKYSEVCISPATDDDVENAIERRKPIIEC